MELLVISSKTATNRKKINVPPTKFEQWPRLIELSWMVCDFKGKIYKINSSLIIPDRFKIENAHIHGITTEKAKEEGRQLKHVLAELRADMMQSDLNLAHNVDLHMGAIAAEEYRCFNYAISDKLQWFCTQKQTGEVLKMPRTLQCLHEGPYKFPTLKELMLHCFSLDIPTAHRAADTAEQCRMVFFELVRRKEINPLEPYKSQSTLII